MRLVVPIGQGAAIELEFDLPALARSQFHPTERFQLLLRPHDRGIPLRDIELHDLGPGAGARVGQGYTNGQRALYWKFLRRMGFRQ